MSQDPARPRGSNLLLVGTLNRHKLMEISAALDDLAFPDGEPIQVVGTERLPPGKAAEETGKTFEENARIKVESCARRARRLPPGERPRWVLADDSGLVVDALDGAPGVRSARYAGPHATDQDNNRKLLQALKNIEPGRRSAKFVCVVACVDLAPGESGASQTAEPLPLLYAQGECRGEILTEAEGHDGFGYDPLFFLPELGKTMAQLTRKEKNEVSHRGRALKALKEGHWRKMRA